MLFTGIISAIAPFGDDITNLLFEAKTPLFVISDDTHSISKTAETSSFLEGHSLDTTLQVCST